MPGLELLSSAGVERDRLSVEVTWKPRTLYLLSPYHEPVTYFERRTSLEVSTNVIPILLARKLWHTEVKYLTPGHTARKWPSRDLN